MATWGAIDTRQRLSLVWICTICHSDSVHHPFKEYILPAVSTTLAQRHMERHGFDLNGRPVHRGQKRRANSMLEYVDLQHTADNSTFNEKGWIDAFARWTVVTNQSLRQASSQSHLRLLTFQNLRVESWYQAAPTQFENGLCKQRPMPIVRSRSH